MRELLTKHQMMDHPALAASCAKQVSAPIVGIAPNDSTHAVSFANQDSEEGPQ